MIHDHGRPSSARRRAAPPAGAPAESNAAATGVVKALAGLVVLVAPFALAWGAWSWLRTTEGFAVRRVVFAGVRHADEAALAEASGALGHNALGLDLQAVRERLVASPWIADATVRRSLPHELRVAVIERVPVAIEAGAGGGRVVDAEGRVLADAPGAFTLPEIRGLDALAQELRDERRARAAATLAALASEAPALAGRIEAIDASAADRLVVIAAGCPPLWVLGPQCADEVAAWARRERGIGRAVGGAAWVDARWRDRLFVMPSST